MQQLLGNKESAFLLDPAVGHVVEVPRAEVNQALSEGYLPADKESITGHQTKKHFEERGLEAGLLAAARGASFGLSDLALSGGAYAPEELAGLKEFNPGASLLGDIGGAAASLGLGGPAAMVGKFSGRAGARAAGLAGRVMARSAMTGVPKLAGRLTAGAIGGAAYGLGSGISNVSMTSGPQSAEDILTTLGDDIAKGAAFGMGLGGASWAVGEGARAAYGKFSFGLKRMNQIRVEKTALQAERDAMVASGEATGRVARIEAQIGALEQELYQKQSAAVGRVASRLVAYGAISSIGLGPGAGLLGVMLTPSILKAVKAAFVPVAGKIKRSTAEAFVDYLSPAADAANEKASGFASRVSPYLNTAAGRLSEMGAAAGRAGKSVLGAVGDVAARIPDPVAMGFSVAGVQGAAAGLSLHFAGKPIGDMLGSVANKLIPKAHAGALNALSRDDWTNFTSQLLSVDGNSLDATVKLLLPEQVKPEVSNEIVARLDKAVEQIRATPEKKQADVASAVFNPDAVISKWLGGKGLPKEQLQALDALYPEAMQQLRLMAISGTLDKAHRDPRARQLGIAQGKTSSASPQLRAMYSPQSTERPRKSTRALGAGQQSATRMQQVSSKI